MLLRCPDCGVDLPDRPDTCPGCGKRLQFKAVPPPVPIILVRKPFWSVVTEIIMILAIIVVIIAALAVPFTQPLTEMKLVLSNEHRSSIHIGIYIDGKLKEIVYIEYGDSYTSIYKLAWGTHTVGFDYSLYDLETLDGVIDELYSFELVLLHPRTLTYTF